ncbi:MAG: imidazole glycerol phosphate synthase subunit HisH [Alphaproteobacteria bacterium]|nr:imidazole glycerol phosphate synthase subunit HisH [Alphaproteobacteria bacterium]
MIVIVDYGSGNLRSAAKAFERAAGADAGAVRVSALPEDVRAAARVVLPGVGAFADCHAGLAAIPGMVEALREAVIDRGRPFLGICVGMQLMAEVGVEHGRHAGLGWIPGEAVRLAPDDPALKIPHMGWNNLNLEHADHPLFAGIQSGSFVYFVHSYHLCPRDRAHRLASTDYGGLVTAVVGRDNLAGTQFHPEKSQEAGLRLIANFLAWQPR